MNIAVEMSGERYSLALRALRDREALRATLRRAAGKLRDVQRACAGLADVIEEVESTLDASAQEGSPEGDQGRREPHRRGLRRRRPARDGEDLVSAHLRPFLRAGLLRAMRVTAHLGWWRASAWCAKAFRRSTP